MGGFRDYRSAARAGAQARDGGRCAAPEPGASQVQAVFERIVEESWSPSEIGTLRRTASSALL